MTITPNKPETAPLPEAEQEFNWRNCWYPVTFSQDLPNNRPYGFTLYDEPLVLFRNSEGELVCLRDLCPHRAAKLSDGQIIDGKIECLYHGWQFGSEGECLQIPQLPEEAKIPATSCVKSYRVVERQGMVWMWAGDFGAADKKLIPTIADLDKPEFVTTDFISDRPYDRTYFIENVLDPAHFPISHHGSLNNRQNAQPLEMKVLETSVGGIQSRFRGTRKENGNWINLDFVAPNLVSYRLDLPKPGYSAGAAIYSLPLGKGRCRVLLRNYLNFPSWKNKLMPRWLDHFFRNRVSEEDMIFIIGQQARMERSGETPNSLYLPLKTSDTILIEYRKWLDKFGTSLPFYQGYSTGIAAKNNNNYEHKMVLLNRYSRHTQICSSCKRAYQVTHRIKQISIGVAIALLAAAILVDTSRIQIIAVSISLLAVIIASLAQILKSKFELSYTRH